MTSTALTNTPPDELDPRRCGARKLNGLPCKRWAGQRTDHPGMGKCSLHGGATPMKHGRYSTLKHARLSSKIQRYEADPDPLNVFSELALLRAITEDYIERYQENNDAILAWHESYIQRPIARQRIEALQRMLDECERRMRESDDDPSESEHAALAESRDTVMRLQQAQDHKPRQILDLSSAKDLVSEVTKIAERVERIRSQDAISRPELLRVMTHMGRVVESYVKDPNILDRIRTSWLDMHV